MKIKFENPSVSGISRMYPGFRLHIPGHAIDEKAVILDVPEEFVENVKNYLSSSAPVIVMTVLDAKDDEAERLAAEAAARAEAEKAAEEAKAQAEAEAKAAQEQAEAEAAEAAAKEAAEKAAKEKAEAEAAQAAAMRPHGRRGGR